MRSLGSRVQGITGVEERRVWGLGNGHGMPDSRERERLGAGRSGMAGRMESGARSRQWGAGGSRRTRMWGSGGSQFRAIAVLRFWFPGMLFQGCSGARGPTHPSPPPRSAPRPSTGTTDGAAPQRPSPQSRLQAHDWGCCFLPVNGSWGCS